jgi:hypothetical protein
MGTSLDDFACCQALGGLFRRDGLLITDTHRLRIEDEYTLSGNTLSICNQDPALPDFRRFLNKAEMRREPLPSWWPKAKRRECEKLAKGPDVWTEIDCAVEKDDIVEHYGDASMPMFLRLFAEKVGAEVHSAWQLVFSPSHSCSSSDCYPSMRATEIKAISREYQALTLYCGWTALVAGEEHYGESLQARLVI